MAREPIAQRHGSADLQRKLAELEFEREQLRRAKRRNMLFAGLAISLLVHLSIMWYLDSIRKASQSSGQPSTVFVEFNVVNEEELTQLEDLELEEQQPESLSDLSEMPEADPLLDQDVTPPAAELEVGEAGSIATLGGGAAGGGDMSLGGGSADASFFGISSRGTRFCYVVDISGSMSGNRKLFSAMRELARSVDSLPDFASFHVLLFSSEVYQPPWQDGWTKAREREVQRLIGWLEQVSPGGGTNPVPAFNMAFNLEVPPDVIFFLTDGQIPQRTVETVRNLNRGIGCVVNTIAFGDPRSQDFLKKIASESGGIYRFTEVEQ